MNKIVPYQANRSRSSPYYPSSHTLPSKSNGDRFRVMHNDDGSDFETLEIDIGDYDQRDISVQIHADNRLVVHALHYFSYQDNSNFVRKELLRTFELPYNADQEYISSSLGSSGVLTIHVPLNRPAYNANRQDAMVVVPFRRQNMRLNVASRNFSPTLSISDKQDVHQRHDSSIVDIAEPTRSCRRSSMFNRFIPSQFKYPERWRTSSVSKIQRNNRVFDEQSVSVGDFMNSSLKPEYVKRNHSIIVRLNMRGYKAQDISIKVDDLMMNVLARTSDDRHYNKQRRDVQSFHKQFRLPDETDTSKIKSELASGGILAIEIPLKKW